MAAYCSLLLVILFTLSIIFFGCIYHTSAHNSGFSVELIHRDSPKSPFYNSTETPFQRITNAIHRSFNRLNHFYPQQIQGSPYPQSETNNVQGEFLMKYAIGSPPFDVTALVDTGSDIIWLQCMPCGDTCYHQDAPIFDPSKSSSYQKVPCSWKVCGLVRQNSCGGSDCLYKASYADGSYSKGNVAFETFTLGTNVTNTFISYAHVLIGCGHDNDARYFTTKVGGIVGLGGGVVSLTSQLNTSFDNKFSYCLVPIFKSKTTSKLNFGENAVLSGPGTVTTPLTIGHDGNTFYYLTLEGMSVGPTRLELFVAKSTLNGANGNIVIDTGTILTHLPEEFYNQLEAEVAAQINLPRVTSPNPLMKLCYSSPRNTIVAPDITAHFTGADVILQSSNTFISLKNNVACFAFIPSSSGSIYGNIAQWDFLVGYDRMKKTVSFKSVDCTNF